MESKDNHSIKKNNNKVNERLKFVLFAFPRTGSSTLNNILNLHPEISSLHEPLNPSRGIDWGVKKKLENYSGQVKDIVSLNNVLKNIFSNYNGIKHLDYQLPFSLNEQILENEKFKIIFLWRKNILQQLVSNNISRQSNYWGENRKKITNRQFKPINIRTFSRFIDRKKKELIGYRKILESNNLDYFDLKYEDIFDLNLSEAQKLKKISTVFSYLGVKKLC